MGEKIDSPEGSGKGLEIPYESTKSILNDLTRGQWDMMNAIEQIAINSHMI